MIYRYRLYLEDGSEAGEAHYAVMVRPGGDDLDGRRPPVARGRPRAG